MSEERKEKKRSPNFTTQEVDLLCDLVVKYSTIIESKKTDCHTWQEKNTAWQKLTAEFNNLSQGLPRTTLNLRGKYESFKKELRKKASKQKMDMYKTGGGISEVPKLTPAEEKIYSLIILSVDGLPARFDDDGMSQDVQKDSEFEKIEENLSTEKQSIEQNEQQIIYIETFENESDSLTLPINKPSTSHYASEKINSNEIDKSDQNSQTTWKEWTLPINEPSTSHYASEKNNSNEIDKSDQKSQTTWKEWTPKTLKGPVSKSLKVMRKEKQALTKLQASQKINTLAESKKELIDLQIQYIKKEMENIEQQHKLKLKKAEEDLKSSKLDVEIKELEKNIKTETLKKILHNNFNLP